MSLPLKPVPVPRCLHGQPWKECNECIIQVAMETHGWSRQEAKAMTAHMRWAKPITIPKK